MRLSIYENDLNWLQALIGFCLSRLRLLVMRAHACWLVASAFSEKVKLTNVRKQQYNGNIS